MPRRKKAETPAPALPTAARELPLLAVRDTVMFPHMVNPLFVARPRSVRAIEEAMKGDRTIAIVTQRVPEKEDISSEDIHSIGTVAVIGRVLRMPDGMTSVLVQGQERIRVTGFPGWDPYIKVTVEYLPDPIEKDINTEALMRAVLALFEKTVKLSRTLPDDAYVAAMNVDEPGWLADLIASSLDLTLDQRQDILETLHPVDRLQKVSLFLAKELDVLELQSQIDSQVQQEVGKSQREYFLREQLKAIQKELGETDPQAQEVTDLREKIEQARMPEDVAKKATAELERLSHMPAAAPEVGIIRTYLDWLVALPWVPETTDNLDIKAAAKVLDENHYGLPKVKERILEFMAVRKLAGARMRSPILCFVGPPGVGKTSLGRSIAQALGRKFVRVSLGGIRDEAEIRGHRRTYIGALPGRVIQTMRTAGTINPLFMLDEIDKVGMDFRGDPSAALLEVLDPEQNHAFSDHYLDVPYDLSKVMFVTTANVLDPVPPALRDRMEVIELPGYTEEEKLCIAKQFLVKKQLEENGLKPGQLRFSDGALRRIIREYTREAGVRNLEREIGSVCRKVARRVAENQTATEAISSSTIPTYLGPPRFFYGTAEEKDEIGAATGVAWTPVGGDTITVEVTLMDGKGEMILTGQLGETMKESAQAALSYARSRARELAIDPAVFDKTTVHIHIPAGAIPKDGPSAGITMATALISAFTRTPVRRDVAMTGEITLRGRVLPIGGLKEKVLAAHRAGIRNFILPARNSKDLTEIPPAIHKEMHFILVEQMNQVIEQALRREPAALAPVAG